MKDDPVGRPVVRAGKQAVRRSHETFPETLLALQTAAYINMSQKEAAEYDPRRLRISEIWAALGKFKPR
jgi:hypothetical protein